MFCLACTMPCSEDLCARCRLGLRAAPEVTVGVGVDRGCRVRHEGTGATARACVEVPGGRCRSRAARRCHGRDDLPATATALVPIPRARFRALRYGVDPAAVLAAAVGRRTGLPVVDGTSAALVVAPTCRAHARNERSPISFAATGEPVPRRCRTRRRCPHDRRDGTCGSGRTSGSSDSCPGGDLRE